MATKELTLEDRTRQLLDAITLMQRAVPLHADLATANEQEAAFAQREKLSSYRSIVQNARDRYRDVALKLEPMRLTFNLFRACQIEFEKALADCEALPVAEHITIQKQMDTLRESLRILRNGPNTLGGPEFMPTLLWTRLQYHGARPEPGAQGLFEGRGGLLFQVERITRLEAERDAASKELESVLASAEKALLVNV